MPFGDLVSRCIFARPDHPKVPASPKSVCACREYKQLHFRFGEAAVYFACNCSLNEELPKLVDSHFAQWYSSPVKQFIAHPSSIDFPTRTSSSFIGLRLVFLGGTQYGIGFLQIGS